MFFKGIFLVSFDLMHEINNLKELTINAAQIPVKAAQCSYPEQKTPNNT